MVTSAGANPEERLEVVIRLVAEDAMPMLLVEDQVDFVAVEARDALGFVAHQGKCLMSALTHPDRQAVIGGRSSELDQFTPLLHHFVTFEIPRV